MDRQDESANTGQVTRRDGGTRGLRTRARTASSELAAAGTSAGVNGPARVRAAKGGHPRQRVLTTVRVILAVLVNLPRALVAIRQGDPVGLAAAHHRIARAAGGSTWPPRLTAARPDEVFAVHAAARAITAAALS